MPIDGRIYKSAPTTQSAALFCPYRLHKFEGASDWVHAITVLFSIVSFKPIPASTLRD